MVVKKWRLNFDSKTGKIRVGRHRLPDRPMSVRDLEHAEAYQETVNEACIIFNILRSKINNRFYIGITNNIIRRLLKN